MNSTFPSHVNDEIYLSNIISQQPYLFFQLTIDADNSLRFDYLKGQLEFVSEMPSDLFVTDPWQFFREKIYPKDKRIFLNKIQMCIQNFENLDLEYRIITNKNILKWLRTTATIQKNSLGKYILCGVISDITKQKEQEEQFKILELRSQFANLASGIGVWDWNMQTNEVFYSAESLKILEIENANQHLISNPKKWDERVHPDDKEQYFRAIKEHFDNKIPYYETYHRVFCKNHYKWILDRGKVIERDVLGLPLRIIGTHTDVTSQKEEQIKLEETLALVNEQKSKLLNFAHIVSHNLRNHAGNFSSLLSLFKNEMLSEKEVFDSLETVSNELSSTLQNLVELVNIQETNIAEKQSLSLKYYFNKVVLVLQDAIHKEGVVLYDEIPENVMVKSLPAYLESILLNLTTNAIKYSDKNKIPYIKYSVTELEDYFVFNVEDNGIGIDTIKHKESIFGLYKTFHQHKDSTGIGLYITKNQIEAMGGKIVLESEVGVGSVFKVYFKK